MPKKMIRIGLLGLAILSLAACTNGGGPVQPNPPGEEVTVGRNQVVVQLPSGGTVTFPAVERGTAKVLVAESDEALGSELDPLERLTTAVTLTAVNEAEWPDGSVVTIRLPVDGAGSLRVASFVLSDSVGVIRIADAPDDAPVGLDLNPKFLFTRPLAPSVSPPTDPPLPEEDGFVEVHLPPGVLFNTNTGRSIEVRVVGNVAEWRERFVPEAEGVYRVRKENVPSTAIERDAACDTDEIDDLLTTDLNGPRDTAVVMVHGWQTLGQVLKLKLGDNAGHRVHCTGWIEIMSAFGHTEGEWAEVRETTDLFTFRYDSDHRIVESGAKLADALEDLKDLGYSNIILLGHSMGGLVSVEARRQMGRPAFLKGIVTLGTPFMGGILECAETRERVVGSDPDPQPYCTDLVPIEDQIAWAIDLILPLDGTYDLSQFDSGVTALIHEPNPYLQRLWNGENNPNFTNIYAIYGDSNLSDMQSGLGGVIAWNRIYYGHNDSAVPVSSALASKNRYRSTQNALPHSELDDIGKIAVARDHNQLIHGCTPCSDGRDGDPEAYDPYLDEIATGLLTFIGPPETGPVITGISPNPIVALAEKQSITVSGNGFTQSAVVTLFEGEIANDLAAADVQFVSTTELTIQAVIATESQDWGIVVTDPDSGISSPRFAFTAVPAAPDLVVTSLNVPLETTAGATIDVTFFISNVGTVASNPSVTHVRINDDPNDVTTADTLLAEVQTPIVNPGELEPYTIEVVIPADFTEDIYSIWVIADANTQAGQIDESNDRAFENIIVRGQLTPCQDPEEIVDIPDEDLVKRVLDALERPSGPITCSDMLQLVELHVSEWYIDDLTGLQHAQNLELLDIGMNDVRSLAPIAGLTTLHTLVVDDNETSDLGPLAGLINLVELSARSNEIEDIEPLINLSSLRHLDLGSNRIVDVSSLAELTGLEELYLDSNAIGDLAPLGTMANLKLLSLSGLVDSDLTALSSLVDLESLVLEGHLTDLSPLTQLHGLRELVVGAEELTDLSPLATLIGLSHLTVWATSLDDIGPIAGLTDLEFLDLSNNQIRDITPIANLVNLTYLDLYNNDVSDITPLTNHTHLEWLTLSNNAVSDITPLANKAELEWLLLNNNVISDITAAASLPSLETLWLSDNNVSDITPLGSLTNLNSVFLDGNKVRSLAPLVDNGGFGTQQSAQLRIRHNCLDLTAGSVDMQDIATLEDRDIFVWYEPQDVCT